MSPRPAIAGLWFCLTLARLPAEETRPIIQELELRFSLVSHHLTNSTRIGDYELHAQPPGNYNYALPHLVCDPIVTLLNPHPDPVTIDLLRIRISTPPVGFRFAKNGNYLREAYAAGEFHGLGRFELSQQWNPAATKTFTLLLRERDETTGEPGAPITLQPGERRSYSPWVEDEWNWLLENPGDYQPRSFFDWSPSHNFTNTDGRTDNPLGVECLPGPDLRAGFQWDHLADTERPAATLYPFESTRNGWVAIKLWERFTVEARSQPMPAEGPGGGFRISVLRGIEEDVAADLLQDFLFDLDQLESASDPPGAPIRREVTCGAILQTHRDPSAGGKLPFARLTATARPDALIPGALSPAGPLAGDAFYQLRFSAIGEEGHQP